MRVLVEPAAPEPHSIETLLNRGAGFPSAVTITRTSRDDYQTRQLVVSIDGCEVATLLWGDTVTWPLEAGAHRLRIHNTLVWKTVEFVLAPGEQVFFEAINRSGRGTLLMTLLFGIGPLYVTIKRM
jgi:hypothetical protein